jgi:hypothetical protein
MDDAEWWEMLAKALMVDVLYAEHMGDVGRSVREALRLMGIKSGYDDEGRPCWEGQDDWPPLSRLTERDRPGEPGKGDDTT